MPVFRFEAMDQAGRSESGVIEADSQRHARVLLRLRLLMPLSVKPQKDEAQSQRRSFFQKGLSGTERVVVIRQLASLMGAGIPLDEALAAVAAEAEQSFVRDRMVALRSEVLGGSSLASAMARQSRDFPAIYQALVAAGEQSGRLAWVLERLADYAETRDSLQQKFPLPGFFVI